MQLENRGQAHAFFTNIIAHPISREYIASQSAIECVHCNSDFVEDFIESLDGEVYWKYQNDGPIRLTNFSDWAEFCEDALVTGYCVGYRYFWQLPYRLQNECYRLAKRHQQVLFRKHLDEIASDNQECV